MHSQHIILNVELLVLKILFSEGHVLYTIYYDIVNMLPNVINFSIKQFCQRK